MCMYVSKCFHVRLCVVQIHVGPSLCLRMCVCLWPYACDKISVSSLYTRAGMRVCVHISAVMRVHLLA